MNKILVVYKSKYGAAKKYANMIKEEIPCDVFNLEDNKKIAFKTYDCIVFAGGIYGSGIAGLNVLRKNYQDLKHKKIAVFCVGASPFDEKAFEEIKSHNLKDDLRNLPVFYGRGAWNKEKMNFIDRTMCKMLQKMVAKKNPAKCEPWMKALLSSTGEKCDWTDRKYLLPLFDYMKSK